MTAPDWSPLGEAVTVGIARARESSAPRRGRGRPAVGPSVHLRLPAELRARLDSARRPGEALAEAARRLLAVALADVLPDALALAAASWDDVSTVYCLDCGPMADGQLCAVHAEALDRAEAARALLAELDDGSPRQ